MSKEENVDKLIKKASEIKKKNKTKSVSPEDMKEFSKLATDVTGGITQDFMVKTTENQVIMQKNQCEFEKYLNKIIDNQEIIIKKINQLSNDVNGYE